MTEERKERMKQWQEHLEWLLSFGYNQHEHGLIRYEGYLATAISYIKHHAGLE